MEQPQALLSDIEDFVAKFASGKWDEAADTYPKL